jgi:signal transduction histidine kinase
MVFFQCPLVFDLDCVRSSGQPDRMSWVNGFWNEVGATLGFGIAPAWYQSFWFRVFCIALGILVVWTLYRLRVQQVTRAISARFDEQLAERTRIARELNDTLLQTVEGSKLVADDALERSNDSEMRSAMEKLSGWLEQGTQEGQAALNSLGSSTTDTNDLTTQLRRATEECGNSKSMDVGFSVTGNIREMRSIARDETFRIGYEAIRNACEHSLATELKVELNYAQDLTLRVHDNGVGIDSSVVNSGKSSHGGLPRMRERANRIRSRLTIVSAPNSGTEITLVVPGRLIFQSATSTRWERMKAMIQEINPRSDLD